MKITFSDLTRLKLELLNASPESFRPEIFKIFDKFIDEKERERKRK